MICHHQLNLQWDMGDASMVYVSWSQGFKSGGFSAADDGEPGDFCLLRSCRLLGGFRIYVSLTLISSLMMSP